MEEVSGTCLHRSGHNRRGRIIDNRMIFFRPQFTDNFDVVLFIKEGSARNYFCHRVKLIEEITFDETDHE